MGTIIWAARGTWCEATRWGWPGPGGNKQAAGPPRWYTRVPKGRDRTAPLPFASGPGEGGMHGGNSLALRILQQHRYPSTSVLRQSVTGMGSSQLSELCTGHMGQVCVSGSLRWQRCAQPVGDTASSPAPHGDPRSRSRAAAQTPGGCPVWG